MNEIASAVSVARMTRSVMYVKTLNVRSFASAASHCASSYSIAALPRERVGHPLHPHEARSLHEDRRAAGGLRACRIAKRVDVLEVARAGTECGHGIAARLAHGQQRIHARLARLLAHLGLHRRRLVSQLAHVGHHEDLAQPLLE